VNCVERNNSRSL